MSATQTAQPDVKAKRSKGRRLASPTAGSAQSVPMRRRWGRIAVGAVLALVGGWVSLSLYLTAGDRVEVVAVSGDVPAYSELTKDDLTTVRVAADPEVDTISGSDLDDLVGRHAAVELVEGSLLSPEQLFAEDAPVVLGGETVVPLALPVEEVVDSLRQGDDVRLIIQSGDDDDDTGNEVPGWVLDIGSADDDEKDRKLEVVVSNTSAADVVRAAKDARVSVVVDGEG